LAMLRLSERVRHFERPREDSTHGLRSRRSTAEIPSLGDLRRSRAATPVRWGRGGTVLPAPPPSSSGCADYGAATRIVPSVLSRWAPVAARFATPWHNRIPSTSPNGPSDVHSCHACATRDGTGGSRTLKIPSGLP
jgi:hypothetical protein